ncbi:hypothetical protein AVEN_100670-1 [Araneus ventricosus]|uniref:tRNA pseudouridine synthase A n=1 Tax=Araneus ventricosus TaxID=182803 RepID=A0A4Y2TBS8_ARAVE|nr:hypothetical protein AVEN_100670-1 [Araneus ventricosus]
MVRYLLRLGYIGTKYSGTQKQINVAESKTIQNVIEMALLEVETRESHVMFVQLRTDKGVHAPIMTLPCRSWNHKITR